MYRAVILSFALAACSKGTTTSSGAKDWTPPSEGVRLLKIIAVDGAVEVYAEEGAALAVHATGHDVEQADVVRHEADVEIRVPASAGLASLTVRAPPGLDLRVLSGGASVAVRGAWGHAEVATRDGPVQVDATLAGGRIRTVTGAVDATCRGSDLVADLEVRSDSGNLHVRLPASFQGGVQVGGPKGGITIVPHKRQSRMVWDPDETNVKGWVGPVPSQADLEGPEWKDRPSVLARTKTGSVKFELQD